MWYCTNIHRTEERFLFGSERRDPQADADRSRGAPQGAALRAAVGNEFSKSDQRVLKGEFHKIWA